MFSGTVRAEGLAGFSLPRQHSLVHYYKNIKDFGAPNGLCSSITESKHIVAVKRPWRRSNRYKALSQILKVNERLDKLVAARADFKSRGMLVDPPLVAAILNIKTTPNGRDNNDSNHANDGGENGDDDGYDGNSDGDNSNSDGDDSNSDGDDNNNDDDNDDHDDDHDDSDSNDDENSDSDNDNEAGPVESEPLMNEVRLAQEKGKYYLSLIVWFQLRSQPFYQPLLVNTRQRSQPLESRLGSTTYLNLFGTSSSTNLTLIPTSNPSISPLHSAHSHGTRAPQYSTPPPPHSVPLAILPGQEGCTGRLSDQRHGGPRETLQVHGETVFSLM